MSEEKEANRLSIVGTEQKIRREKVTFSSAI
jgi:hypothetical protein